MIVFLKASKQNLWGILIWGILICRTTHQLLRLRLRVRMGASRARKKAKIKLSREPKNKKRLIMTLFPCQIISKIRIVTVDILTLFPYQIISWVCIVIIPCIQPIKK